MPSYRVNRAAVDKARGLIDDGTYDDSTPWSEAAPSTDRENSEIERSGDLVVVGRGSHDTISEAFHAHNPEMRKTLGPVAEALISGGVKGSVLVGHRYPIP